MWASPNRCEGLLQRVAHCRRDVLADVAIRECAGCRLLGDRRDEQVVHAANDDHFHRLRSALVRSRSTGARRARLEPDDQRAVHEEERLANLVEHLRRVEMREDSGNQGRVGLLRNCGGDTRPIPCRSARRRHPLLEAILLSRSSGGNFMLSSARRCCSSMSRRCR